MPIATASINHVFFTTFGALIDGSAVMRSAAIDDGIDYFTMLLRHSVTEPLDILRAVGVEDIFNRCHGHLLSSSS